MIRFDEGNYRAKILKQEISESKNGNAQVVFTIEPMGAYDQDGESLLECPSVSRGFEPRIFLTLTDNTIDWVLETLAHLGLPGGKGFADLDPTTEGHHSFVGIECDVRCTYDEYNGQQREKWQINRGGKQLKPVAKAFLRKLDAKWGKKLKGITNSTPATTPAPALAVTTPPVTSEDIPF